MRRIVLFSVTLLVGATCVALGIWQLGRLAARKASNRQAVAGRVLPQLVVDSVNRLPLAANRRALLAGELDPAHEFLLRNRLVRGVPAVLVVTPLRIPGRDTAILVNRGYVPAPDAVEPGLAKWDEPGLQRFHGVLLPLADQRDGAPVARNNRETWKRLDLTAMRARLPYPISALYLLAEADSADGPAHTLAGRVYPFRADIPPTDEGPHLMYAVQWFGIAAAVVAFGVVFILMGAPQRAARPSAGNGPQ